jgi:3,4-dihydroxy 2-butanone 4-phosphate synthase/GTP cyclohydrolase II
VDGSGRFPGTSTVFSSIDQALQEIADGGMVVVLADGDRENEGDLVMAAGHVTAADVAFIVRHTSGVVCVALTPERCTALDLPLMVPDHHGGQQRRAFTHSVDLARATTTGVSAAGRAATISALADWTVTGAAFARPGHVFPLRARARGVLEHAARAEAALDLARMAGLGAAGVLCEIVDADGALARRPDLVRFAAEHGLPMITIADLVEYRRRSEVVVERTEEAQGQESIANLFALRVTERRAGHLLGGADGVQARTEPRPSEATG